MDSQKPYDQNSPSELLSCCDSSRNCTIGRENEEDNVEPSWDQLPSELLKLIADRLGIVELLRFRCVCKEWFYASSSSSAEIESFNNPWFLIYGKKTVSVLYNDSEQIYYILNIPELENGGTCVASEKGWLLLIKNTSIYFFCPFSGAKIMLPKLSIEDYWNYLAAFSSPPTSPDCKVCFFRLDRSSNSFELYVLVRGATSWTKQFLNSEARTGFGTVRAASFHGDQVYFMDDNRKLIIYSFEKRDAQFYNIVQRKPESKNTPGMPFNTERNYIEVTKMTERLELGGRFSLTTCGTRSVMTESQLDTVLFGETINGSAQIHGGEEESRALNLKGVWINPRFFKVSPNFQW